MCSFLMMSFIVLDGKWELQKNENGIKIYTASKAGSSFKKTKAVATLKCDIDKLANWITNPLNYKKFNERIEKVQVLKKTENAVVYYMTVDLPWPVNNRDGIYVLTHNKTNKDLIDIRIKAVPDVLKNKEGYVRVRESNVHYSLKRTADNKVNMTYETYTDPNGKIPAWLSNSYVIDGPFNNVSYYKKNIGY